MKKWFYNLSIKYKMILVMSLISGIVLTLASTTILINDVLRFRQNMVSELNSLASLVALSNDAGIFFGISDTAYDNLKVLTANPNIVEAILFTEDGNLFANYSPLSNDQQEISITLAQYYFATDIPPKNGLIQENSFFRDNHLETFKFVVFEGEKIGMVYLRSDLKAFYDHLWRAGLLFLVVLVASMLIAVILATALQRLLTEPVYKLLQTMLEVARTNDYSKRELKQHDDELGQLCTGFNSMLTYIERRDKELEYANTEINKLNEYLKSDNLRMSAELDITRRLQQMVLPSAAELEKIKELDIAAYMKPADEVGGDYYDVLCHPSGRIHIGIGDVTGHGLESGVLMLMVQTAIRTLLENNISNPEEFLEILNRAIFQNVQRMNIDKNLTMTMLDYHNGKLRISGQHEYFLIFRKDGSCERIDTCELGFMVGLLPDINKFLDGKNFYLENGDGFVLYTDGITEAFDQNDEMYDLERLEKVISENWQKSAKEIQHEVINNLNTHINGSKINDDITLLVVKRRE